MPALGIAENSRALTRHQVISKKVSRARLSSKVISMHLRLYLELRLIQIMTLPGFYYVLSNRDELLFRFCQKKSYKTQP